MEGWIKIHRKILEWEWWDEPRAFRVFIYLILSVTHKDKKWRGIKLYKGEFIQSLETIASGTGLTVRKIRTAIKYLKVTGELTERKYQFYRILKVENFDKYQISDTTSAIKVTGECQESDSKQEGKELKKEKNTLFEKFWSLYEKKKDKEKTLRKFLRLKDPEIEKILEVAGAYVESTPDPKYRKNPLTWLNGRCWEDEIETKKPHPLTF